MESQRASRKYSVSTSRSYKSTDITKIPVVIICTQREIWTRHSISLLLEVRCDLSYRKGRSTDTVQLLAGGTAGCLVASRLANTPSRPTVLLLETGEDNDDPGYRRTYDRFSLALTTSALDHEYTSTPQAALDGRQVAQLRGKGLGGSSQTNFQAWSLGARDEFDHWASVVNDRSWSFDSVIRQLKSVRLQACLEPLDSGLG